MQVMLGEVGSAVPRLIKGTHHITVGVRDAVGYVLHKCGGSTVEIPCEGCISWALYL